MPATNPTLPQTKDNTGKNYFGLTEETFKQWYKQQKLSFHYRKYTVYCNRTELAKHM